MYVDGLKWFEYTKKSKLSQKLIQGENANDKNKMAKVIARNQDKIKITTLKSCWNS